MSDLTRDVLQIIDEEFEEVTRLLSEAEEAGYQRGLRGAQPSPERLAEALHARCIENWTQFVGDFTQHGADAHLRHAESALAALTETEPKP